ncbi:MAG: DinB family protein [Thermomicrobiales bacterium]
MTDAANDSQTIPQVAALEAVIRTEALDFLEEIFATHHGYILDRGTSMFETLAGIDAETASLRYSPDAGTLAAQVNHTRFYLDVVLRSMQGGDNTPADWEASWDVGRVTDAEWTALIDGLRASYDAVHAFIANRERWDEASVGDAMAVVAHSAYHLGEIRQALAVIPLLRPVSAR